MPLIRGFHRNSKSILVDQKEDDINDLCSHGEIQEVVLKGVHGPEIIQGASLEILFGNPDSEFLLIDILSRSYPNYVDYWDGNWLNARVTLSVGGFKGLLSGYLRAEEFLRFRGEIEKLNNTLSGKATFSTMEEWISFSLTGDGRGHVILKGQVRDRPGGENILNFAIELDQTFLPEILKGLEKAIKVFPVFGQC